MQTDFIVINEWPRFPVFNVPDSVEVSRKRMVALADQMNALNDKVQNENRDFTDDELEQMEHLYAEFIIHEERLDSGGHNNPDISVPDFASRSRGRATQPSPVQGQNGNTVPGQRRQRPAGDFHSRRQLSPESQRVLFQNRRTGELVYGYRGTTPLRLENDFPLGDVLSGILLNDLDGLPRQIQNSLTTGSDSGGGYLSAPSMSSRIIDLARAQSVVMRAGAVTVELDGELELARITGDPSTSWRRETGAVTGSKPTFGKFRLVPKMCAAIVPVSLELLEDTPNASAVIESALTSALGVEMDRAVLEGQGSAGEPLGIVNVDGVNSQTNVGTPTTYGQITTAITNILAANYGGDVGGLSWVMNPIIGGTYDGLKTGISSDNTPLEPTPWVRQLQRLYTTNLAGQNSPLDYNMIVGDFSECLVGMRYSGVVIDVLDAGQLTDEDSETVNAVSQFMRFIRARIRIDSLLMRPDWFSVLSGVKA